MKRLGNDDNKNKCKEVIGNLGNDDNNNKLTTDKKQKATSKTACDARGQKAVFTPKNRERADTFLSHCKSSQGTLKNCLLLSNGRHYSMLRGDRVRKIFTFVKWTKLRSAIHFK